MSPLSLSFIFLTKFWSCRRARICGPSNTPVLIFSNDKAGRTEAMCWKHSPSVFKALTNCFIRPSLMCRGENMIFYWMKIGLVTIFGIPTSRVSRKGHSFWFQCLSFDHLSHMQIKQEYFVNSLCWPRMKFTILRSTQIAQWYSCYFSTSITILMILSSSRHHVEWPTETTT